MELFLNLVWLLLAVPAYCLWRKAHATRGSSFSSLQCLLALGCGLVLLFPVVSATDDLHAMRAEMEESASSKRNVRQASSEKASGWHGRSYSPALLVPAFSTIVSFTRTWEELLTPSFFFAAAPHGIHSSRGPPSFELARS